MDSTMYFFSGSDVCLKWIPACAVTSTNCGIGRPLHFLDFAPGGGGGGIGWPLCAEPTGRVAVARRAANSSSPGFNAVRCCKPFWNEAKEHSPSQPSVSSQSVIDRQNFRSAYFL